MKKSIVFVNILALITGIAIVFSCISVSAEQLGISTFTVTVYRQSNQNTPVILSGAIVSINGNRISVQDIAGGGDVKYIVVITPDYSGNVSGVIDTSSFSITFTGTPMIPMGNFSAAYNFDSGSTTLSRTTMSSSFSLANEPSGSGKLNSITYTYSSSNAFNVFNIDFVIAYDDPLYTALDGIQLRLDDQIQKLDQISGKLDQTNDLLEQGLNYTAPASDISDGVNDLGGSLIPDLESGVSDVSSAVSEHMPDINAWLSENPTLVSDMMSFSRLANAVMINFVHADGSIFIYISLACFISLLVVIEVNLKRGGGATVHNVYMSRTTPNDRKEDRYSRRGWGDSHRYFTRDRSYGGRYRR